MTIAPRVPLQWSYEMPNTILMQVRRKRIAFEEAAYLNIIDEMAIDTDPPDSSAIPASPPCDSPYLTSYDAAFLELAMRLKLPLATSDQALVRAAVDAKVPLTNL